MNRASRPDHADAAAPTRLGPLVRLEFRRALQSPYVAPSVVVTNGLLVTAAWFLLPTRWQDVLFSLHGTFAFALVLASWMYADVPATNVLGLGAERSLEALDDPVALGRLLNARDIVLWMLVTPICVLVALGIGIYETQWTRMIITMVTIVVPPFGALVSRLGSVFASRITRSRSPNGGEHVDHGGICGFVGSHSCCCRTCSFPRWRWSRSCRRMPSGP